MFQSFGAGFVGAAPNGCQHKVFGNEKGVEKCIQYWRLPGVSWFQFENGEGYYERRAGKAPVRQSLPSFLNVIVLFFQCVELRVVGRYFFTK